MTSEEKPSREQLQAKVRQLNQRLERQQKQREDLEHKAALLVQSQFALEESLQRYADLYDFAPVGFVSLDRSGNIAEINLTAAALLGADRQELLGKPLRLFVTTERHAALLEHLRRCRAGEQEVNSLVELRSRNGKPTPVELSTRVLPESRSELFRTALVDLTDRQHVQELQVVQGQLRQLNDELAQRGDQAQRQARLLRGLASDLAQAEHRERRRLAQVLHDDLQQLLIAARLHLGLLRSQLPQAIGGQASQIDDLIVRSITVARTLTADLSPPVLYEVGLGAALQWLARRELENHHLTVHVEADKDEPRIGQDLRVFLFQAVREMLLNVVKHSCVSEAWVRLRWLADQQVLQVEVEDHGQGFEAGQLSQGGSGERFGLFSLQQRLALLGGQLDVRSAPGKGATIVLRAPLLGPGQTKVLSVPEALAAQEAGHSRAQPAGPAVAAQGDSFIRVLLADDHKIVREGLATLLEDQPHLQVVGQAADGQAAVTLARRLQPDVVVMDVTMPKLTGLEATRIIHRELPAIRIIGLSMHEEGDLAQAMLQAGATAYLTKGGPAHDLIAAIYGQQVKAAS